MVREMRSHDARLTMTGARDAQPRRYVRTMRLGPDGSRWRRPVTEQAAVPLASSVRRMFGMWIVFALLLVGGQLGYRYLSLKRRAAAAVTATSAAGLHISTEVDEAPPLPFELFNRGSGRRVRNRAWDPNDPNASVFDYEYTVRSGSGNNNSSRTYRQTCAVFVVPFASPHLALSKQNFFDRIAIGFGGHDVVIGHPQFDERYRVRCQDEAFARRVLDPRVVQLLLNEGRDGEIGIEISGSHVLVATGEQIDPSQFDDLLAWGHRLIAHLPLAGSDRPPMAPGPMAPPAPRPTPQAMQQWDPQQGPMAASDAPPEDRPRSTPIE